jgi:hypothetical protein
MRCPKCGAGVRLRVDTVPTTEYTPLADETGAGKTGEPIVEIDSEPVHAETAPPKRRWLWWAGPVAVVLGLAVAALIWKLLPRAGEGP